MSEFDFLNPIPKTTISVKLPSRGVLYRDDTPAGSGKVTLTPMTMVEESLFFDPEVDFNQSIDKILKQCVQENLDINTLLSSDKFFLFMMVRAVTYGAEYTFTWTCPKEKGRGDICGERNSNTIKIPDDFKMKYLGDDDKEPFKVTLPDSQKEIAFRLFRGHDEAACEKYQEEIELRRNDGIRVLDTTAVFRLSRHVVSVDGKAVKDAPQEKLLAFLGSLSAKDRQCLQKRINFYTPGLDTGVVLKCAKCNTVHEWDMPFTADFFRANLDDEGEAVADEVRLNVLPRNEA